MLALLGLIDVREREPTVLLENRERGPATFAAAASSAHSAAPAASSASPVIPLSNVEAMWERLSADEQLVIHQQLEEIQKKDWKTHKLRCFTPPPQ